MANRTEQPSRGWAHLAASFAVFTLLSLCLPGAASAQWATGGNNISNTNTGNVGIGTSTPQAKLDVAGGPAVVDNNQYFGFRRADNAVRRLIGAVDNGAGQHFVDVGQATAYITGIRFWPRDSITSPDVVISGSGYMGVGTAAPVSQLQVRRDHASTTFQNGPDLQLFLQNMNTSANNTVGLAFGGQRADGTSRLAGAVFSQMTSHADGSFASDLVLSVTGPGEAPLEGLRVKSSGNVGIGTAAPATRLDVADSALNGSAARFVQSNPSASNGVVIQTQTASPNDLALYVLSNAGATTGLAVRNTGNVGIGTAAPAAKLHVAGDIRVDGNINAKYQDVAEWVPSTQKLAAGTVVVLDPERPNHVLASTTSYDTAVAGVISERPGLSLGEAGEDKALVATTGRVRVRVDATRAAIKIGDLLVTSNVAGVAMKSEPVVVGGRRMHAPGTIIGKALEPLASGTGEILVLLSLQ